MMKSQWHCIRTLLFGKHSFWISERHICSLLSLIIRGGIFTFFIRLAKFTICCALSLFNNTFYWTYLNAISLCRQFFRVPWNHTITSQHLRCFYRFGQIECSLHSCHWGLWERWTHRLLLVGTIVLCWYCSSVLVSYSKLARILLQRHRVITYTGCLEIVTSICVGAWFSLNVVHNGSFASTFSLSRLWRKHNAWKDA